MKKEEVVWKRSDGEVEQRWWGEREKMDFTGSIINEFKSLPSFWLLWLIAVAGAAWVVDGRKSISRPLLVAYILFILMETVIDRNVGSGRAQLVPFWSYSHPELRMEIILNYILFVPLGFLLYLCYGDRFGLRVVIAGFLLSASIEIAQLVFRIGLFEFDDIFGNTVGCLIGVAIGKVCWEHMKNRKGSKRVKNQTTTAVEGHTTPNINNHTSQCGE